MVDLAQATEAERLLEPDATPDVDCSGPERRCVVTRIVGPKTGMIRFVVGPGDVVVPDIDERLPGRGLWVLADRDALGRAAGGPSFFARAARRHAIVPHGLADTVLTLAAARCRRLLAQARGAGLATFGFERVREGLQAGRFSAILFASDGALDGKTKLRRAAGEAAVYEILDAASLGEAFGRAGIVHVGLKPGGLTDRIVIALRRLAGISGGDAREA